MTFYAECAADQIDHFVDAFVCENVGHVYDVTTLWRCNVYNRRHFVKRKSVQEKGYFNVLTTFSVRIRLELSTICKNSVILQ